MYIFHCKGVEQFTPRTTRKVDSFKEKLAARRIQRTWKHFYQEVNLKKSSGLLTKDGPSETIVRDLFSPISYI